MARNNQRRPGCLFRSGCFALSGVTGFILTVILLIFGIELVLTALGGILIISDSLHETDAAVVLSGGRIGRLEEASRLYEEKYVSWVIITETGKTSPDFGLFSDIDKYEIIRMGVPANQIIITEQIVEDTHDEAVVVRKLANERGFRSLTITTDPFHSLRTRLIFRDVFRDSEIAVYIRPVRGSWYRSASWWTSRDGWEATMSEYVRLFAYFAETWVR